MTSETFEEIFQLIKCDINKENTKIRELIPPRLQHAATIGFLSTGKLYKSYVYEYYSFYSTMSSSTFTSFRAFVFFIFSNHLFDFFLLPKKTSYKNNKKMLHVITIAMICSSLASLWTFQYFRRSIYNPVEQIWWSFIAKIASR